MSNCSAQALLINNMTTATGFAEMFEWGDGNPDNEDRTGHTVVLSGDKIYITERAPYHVEAHNVIGVIGGDNTSVSAISNASPHEWHGKHLRDPANRLLWEDQVMVEWIVDGYRHWYEADRIPDGITVPEDATYYRGVWNGHHLHREVLSEEYKNPGRVIDPYLPRWERREWGIVILLGRAVIKEGSLCHPNWIKLKSISGNISGQSVSEWLVR